MASNSHHSLTGDLSSGGVGAGKRLSGCLQLVGRQERTGQSQGFLVGGLEGRLVAPEKTLRMGQARVRMMCRAEGLWGLPLLVYLNFCNFCLLLAPRPGQAGPDFSLPWTIPEDTVLQHPRTPLLLPRWGCGNSGGSRLSTWWRTPGQPGVVRWGLGRCVRQ